MSINKILKTMNGVTFVEAESLNDVYKAQIKEEWKNNQKYLKNIGYTNYKDYEKYRLVQLKDGYYHTRVTIETEKENGDWVMNFSLEIPYTPFVSGDKSGTNEEIIDILKQVIKFSKHMPIEGSNK